MENIHQLTIPVPDNYTSLDLWTIQLRMFAAAAD